MTPRRWWLLALSVVLLALTAGFVRWFLYPTADQPFTDGPVVVLGEDPSRIAWALEALPLPSAERELLLSHPVETALGDLGAACGVSSVRCIWPEPVSTWGEAQAVADLAATEGWPMVTVVTSRFHLPRSRLLFERCVDVPVALVGSDGADRVPLRRALREAAASVVSAVAYHDC